MEMHFGKRNHKKGKKVLRSHQREKSWIFMRISWDWVKSFNLLIQIIVKWRNKKIFLFILNIKSQNLTRYDLLIYFLTLQNFHPLKLFNKNHSNNENRLTTLFYFYSHFFFLTPFKKNRFTLYWNSINEKGRRQERRCEERKRTLKSSLSSK